MKPPVRQTQSPPERSGVTLPRLCPTFVKSVAFWAAPSGLGAGGKIRFSQGAGIELVTALMDKKVFPGARMRSVSAYKTRGKRSVGGRLLTL
jgi:hypothetical protein